MELEQRVRSETNYVALCVSQFCDEKCTQIKQIVEAVLHTIAPRHFNVHINFCLIDTLKERL
jgi:hypothetical protein